MIVGDRYEVVRSIGAGTQAVVFQVYDHVGGESLAMKTLAVRTRDAVSSFLREAEVLRRLDHPCIVRLHDVLEVGGGPAMLLELVPGGTLRQWMDRRGPLPPGVALEVALQCASGLVHVHARRLVHRDVKPANLLVRADGSVVLSDFGIACPPEDPLWDGLVCGTPAFMAPEQNGRSPVDERADVYAVGATLHRMCTNRRELRLYRCARDASVLAGLPRSSQTSSRGAAGSPRGTGSRRWPRWATRSARRSRRSRRRRAGCRGSSSARRRRRRTWSSSGCGR